MKVAVASDHAGYRLKTVVAEWLAKNGHEVLDLGTDSEESVDYPPFCAAAARAVVNGDADRGVVIGGSGQGEAISANKVQGARAALCHDEWTARLSRQHNDANVLALGARTTPAEEIPKIVRAWFDAKFEAGRHAARVEKIGQIEKQSRSLESGV